VTTNGLAQPATFTPLGFFPLGFPPGSHANDISRDGTTAVGRANLGGAKAFRWTDSATGLEELGTLPMLFESEAHEVSDDGTMIAGIYTFSSGEARPFRWTESGGMSEITGFPAGAGSRGAFGISGDGTVVAGTYRDSMFFRKAYYWTEVAGVVDVPGLSTIFIENAATSVSGNGVYIVGESQNDAGNTEAFRYAVGAPGAEGLGDLAGGIFSSIARAASTLGEVIVGDGNSGSTEAFRWRESIGAMDGLGFLPGASESFANDVSADGSVIVGSSGGLGYRWTEADGMVDIKSYLLGLGATGLTDWTLAEVTGVSGDAMTYVGTGINPDGFGEAWIAHVPEPSFGLFLWVILLFLPRSRSRSRQT
jgi:uncharacterized membrane protein